MKRVEVYLDANGACRRLGVLEYGELRGDAVCFGDDDAGL